MRLRAWPCLLCVSLAVLAPSAHAADDPPSAKADKGGDKADKPDAAPKATAKPGKSGKPASTEVRYDSENVTGISKYNETINKGTAKYLARDFQGALDIYRGTIPLQPKNPLAYYMVAEAQIGAGNLTEAEASLTQAEANSSDQNAALRGKILFMIGDVKERQKRWEDAKTAWQAYVDFAQKHAGIGFPSSATSRIQAIDDMLKQEKAYVAVRERIAAEKASPPAGSPPPKK